MIQRKQTLYLLGVAILMIAMLFLPLATLSPAKGFDNVVFDTWGIHFEVGNGVSLVYFGILTALTAAVALVDIFLFKQRRVQLTLCYALIILLIGVLMFEVFYAVKLYMIDGYVVNFSLVMLFPILSLPMVYLARRGIIRDISLVKSYDRIR